MNTIVPPPYRELFATPGVGRATVGAFAARVAFALLPVALLLAALQAGYSTGEAGLMAGLNALGSAVSGPLQGRVVDRLGIRPVLEPLAIASIAFSSLLWYSLEADWSTPAICATAIVAGAARPYVASTLRSVWWELFPSQAQRNAALSMEAALAQIATFVAPLLASAFVVGTNADAAIGASALLGGLGTLALTRSQPASEWRPDPRSQRGMLGALSDASVVLALASYLFFYASLGFAEVAVAGLTAELGRLGLAGLLLSLIALSQVVGSIVYGAAERIGQVERRLCFWLALGILPLLPLIRVDAVGVVAACFLAFGLLRGPVSPLVFASVANRSRPGTITEALAWVGVTTFAGPAIGRSFGGFLVESGPGVGFAAAAAAMLLATVAAIALRSKTE